LLAEIVSRVTGLSFAEWTKENIFDPLGMTNTLFYDDHEKIVPGRAYSYKEDRNGFKKSVLSYANVGATSLFTTVEDIQKWADNFRTMKVGNEQVMTMMDERGILNNGDTLGYAFGQGYGDYRGLVTRAHSGGDAGYRTFLLRFPEHNYAISVFSNLASFNPAGPAFQVANIFMKDVLNNEEKEVHAQAEERDSESPVEVDESILREYSGRYMVMNNVLVKFRLEEGRFMAQVMEQSSYEVTARSDTTFHIAQGDATVIFKRDEKGAVSGFKLVQGGDEYEAKRLPPFDPELVKPEEYTGLFYSSELQTAYRFNVVNDTLIANHQRHDPIRMSPLSEDKFQGDAWFFRNVEFTRDTDKQITGILVSSGRVRNVRFDKME
jgi:hypothetical protein